MIKPTTQDLEDGIRAYVATGSGLAEKLVIPGNDKWSAPNSLFATVLMIDHVSVGIPFNDPLPTGNNPQAPTFNTVRVRYSVQWFRKAARDAARQFAVWANTPAGLEDIADRGLTFLRVSAVRQLDGIIDDYEERAGLDLEIGYIERLQVSGQRLVEVPIVINSGGQEHTIEVTDAP